MLKAKVLETMRETTATPRSPAESKVAFGVYLAIQDQMGQRRRGWSDDDGRYAIEVEGIIDCVEVARFLLRLEWVKTAVGR